MSEDLFDSPEPADHEADIPRDRWGRYLIPDPTNNNQVKAWTRATTFAKSMMDTYVLNQWQQRMAVKGVAMRPDLLALAAATPLDDRDTLNTLCEDAKKHAGSKDRANLGTAMHAFTQQYDLRTLIGPGAYDMPDVPAALQADFDAYVALVQGLGIQFVEIERVVIVPKFGVAGTFDRLGILLKPLTIEVPGIGTVTLAKGTHIIVDLKTGRDLTYGWNEIVIQLALYANSFAMWRVRTTKFDRMPCLDKRVALVIHLPVGEAKATVYAVNIKAGWEAAKLCAQVRDWRKTKNLAVPLEVASTLGQVIEQSAQPGGAIGTALLDAADQAGVSPGCNCRPGQGCPYCCDQCNTDRHLCPGCGKPVPHGTVACPGCDDQEPIDEQCHGCGEQLNPDQTCSSCDDPAEQQLRAMESSEECDEYLNDRVKCRLTGLHAKHEGDGYTWISDGMRCIQCGREARKGRITHVRGCPDGPRPGRKPAASHGVTIPAELLQPAGVDLLSQIQAEQRRPSTQDTAQPAAETPAVSAVELRPPTWEERISQASSAPELSQIYREASAVGQWNARLLELANEQRTKWRTL
jgi:hypothetical protein